MSPRQSTSDLDVDVAQEARLLDSAGEVQLASLCDSFGILKTSTDGNVDPWAALDDAELEAKGIKQAQLEAARAQQDVMQT